MGFYDCRCMVTGVSLKGSDAALVLLQKSATGVAPIALAIKGNYNRLGSIDGIKKDANNQLVLKFFKKELKSKNFLVDREYLTGYDCFPIQTIEDLLQGFERNMNDKPDSAILHKQPVVYALIARAVWNAISDELPSPRKKMTTVFQNLFKASSIGSKIYAQEINRVAVHVSELAAMDTFLKRRKMNWRPSPAGGQDFPEEMRQYLRKARQTFANSNTIIKALRSYEKEVADLLKDELE